MLANVPSTKWLKMSLFLLVFITLIIKTICDFNEFTPYDYCDPDMKLCPVPKSHTMCQYPVPGPSKDCTPEVNAPLTEDDKILILTVHNKLRSRVSVGEEKTIFGKLPSASNMLQMQWDEELETIARRWAERCLNVTVTKIRDDCRNTKRFNVTQNVGTMGLRVLNIGKQMLQIFYNWFKKSKYFKADSIDIYDAKENEKSQEFTNLIWADSYALGCAKVVFQNNISDSQRSSDQVTWTFERMVCNYGPAGNIEGSSVYKRGAPCSECPIGWGCSEEHTGLCAQNGSQTNLKKWSPATELPSKEISIKTSIKVKQNLEIYAFEESTSPKWTISTKAVIDGISQETLKPSVQTRFQEKFHVLLVPSSDPQIEVLNNYENNNFTLRAGVYYNGVCHCPDITRHGFLDSKGKQTIVFQKLKFQRHPIRQVVRGNYEVQRRKALSDMKQGSRCYCRKTISSAINRSSPSTSLLCLTIFLLSKLLLLY